MTHPEVDWGPTHWVFLRVRDAVVNIMRNYQLEGYYILNPDVVDPPQPNNKVIFQFMLYPKPEPEPAPAGPEEEVPF